MREETKFSICSENCRGTATVQNKLNIHLANVMIAGDIYL